MIGLLVAIQRYPYSFFLLVVHLSNCIGVTPDRTGVLLVGLGIGSTPKGSYGTTRFLRRVPRRFWEGFRGKILGKGRALGFAVKKGSERGAQKQKVLPPPKTF